MDNWLIRYKVKDGSYSLGDQCVSGGSYDLHRRVILTAQGNRKAREIFQAYCKEIYPSHKITIQSVKSLKL